MELTLQYKCYNRNLLSVKRIELIAQYKCYKGSLANKNKMLQEEFIYKLKGNRTDTAIQTLRGKFSKQNRNITTTPIQML